jgi:hypothetical protein
MYCSTCGSPVTTGLSFCNRCGASLGKDKADETSSSPANGLIAALLFVTLFGLGIMFAGAIALKQGGGLPNEVVGMFMFFSFVLIGTVDIFVLRQLSKLMSHGTRRTQVEAPPLFQPASGVSTNELRGVPPRTLPDPLPMPSVTEHTTRTLQQVPREGRGQNQF